MRSVLLPLGDATGLFADTVKGAKASAALYSIVSTARANGLEPYTYLRRLFAELPKAKTVEDFEALLPFTASRRDRDARTTAQIPRKLHCNLDRAVYPLT